MLKSKKNLGFTLVEVITVMAIIGIMTAISIVSLRGARTGTNLENSRREAASAIKLAQSFALQGKTVGGNAPCGFGFRFTDNDIYEIFYIPSGGVSCDIKNDDDDTRNCSDTSCSTLESYNLKNNVTVTASTGKDIYFTIPHGNVYGSTGQTFSGETITFTASDGTTKELSVNSLGLITE